MVDLRFFKKFKFLKISLKISKKNILIMARKPSEIFENKLKLCFLHVEKQLYHPRELFLSYFQNYSH